MASLATSSRLAFVPSSAPYPAATPEQPVRPTRRASSRMLRPLPLPQFDADLHRPIGYGLEAYDIPQAPAAPREFRKNTRFDLIADPALLLRTVTQWGPVALTTHTALGRMTSVVEISRIDCNTEHLILRAAGLHTLHLNRREFQHCVAGAPSSRRGEGDWSFTLNWTDASGQPLLDLAILNPTRITTVTDSLRPFLFKHTRPSVKPAPQQHWTPAGPSFDVSTPIKRLSLDGLPHVLAVRDNVDAMRIDLHSHAVRHRYVGPLLLQRHAGSHLSTTGDGCSLQISTGVAAELALVAGPEGAPGARILSQCPGELLHISPASGDEFASWWLARQIAGPSSH